MAMASKRTASRRPSGFRKAPMAATLWPRPSLVTDYQERNYFVYLIVLIYVYVSIDCGPSEDGEGEHLRRRLVW